MSRVSQLAQQTLTLNNVLNAQQRIQDSQIQIPIVLQDCYLGYSNLHS